MKLLLLFVSVALFLGGCAFKEPMVASPTGDGKYWILIEDLTYQHPQTHRQFKVPRGFVTDLASVPRLFWSAFPPCGQYTPAAVVHDYLYWQQDANCDRECADEILLVAMEESNVKWLTRQAIFNAVRLGGQSAWDDNKQAKASGAIRLLPPEYMKFSPEDTWAVIERRVREGKANMQR